MKQPEQRYPENLLLSPPPPSSWDSANCFHTSLVNIHIPHCWKWFLTVGRRKFLCTHTHTLRNIIWHFSLVSFLTTQLCEVHCQDLVCTLSTYQWSKEDKIWWGEIKTVHRGRDLEHYRVLPFLPFSPVYQFTPTGDLQEGWFSVSVAQQ